MKISVRMRDAGPPPALVCRPAPDVCDRGLVGAHPVVEPLEPPGAAGGFKSSHLRARHRVSAGRDLVILVDTSDLCFNTGV